MHAMHFIINHNGNRIMLTKHYNPQSIKRIASTNPTNVNVGDFRLWYQEVSRRARVKNHPRAWRQRFIFLTDKSLILLICILICLFVLIFFNLFYYLKLELEIKECLDFTHFDVTLFVCGEVSAFISPLA